MTFIKSRTNTTKRSIPLIFNKSEGRFDEILSLFHLLKTEGRFSGAGAYLYLDDVPDVKFSQRNFKSVLQSNVDLQKAFAKECYNVLSGYLSETKRAEVSISDSIANINSIFDDMSVRDE
jgi:hypothetical protein